MFSTQSSFIANTFQKNKNEQNRCEYKLNTKWNVNDKGDNEIYKYLADEFINQHEVISILLITTSKVRYHNISHSHN